MSLFRRSSLPTPNPDQPGHSILLNGPSSASSSTSIYPSSSTSSTSSHAASPPPSSSSTTVSTTSRRPRSSSKVSFAPLPQVPPELKRRSSITLGVAARKNLLSAQSGGAGYGPGRGAGRGGGEPGGSKVVYMSDEDWEAYKKQYEEKHGPEPVDLGELAKSSAKSLWKRVRSSSQSSNTSSASSLPSSSPTTPTTIPQSPRRGLRDPPGGPSKGSPPASPVNGLGTVHEESTGGVAVHPTRTTRSPPPGATRRESFDDWAHSQGRGGVGADVLVAEEGRMRKVGLVGAVDGDATPRRRPSPPPPIHTAPLEEDETQGREGDEAEDETNLPSQVGRLRVGPSTPPAIARRSARASAVLGFDDRKWDHIPKG